MTEEKRRRYCEGIASEEYIKTGIPRNSSSKQKKEDEEHIQRMLEENEKNTAHAAKNYRKRKSKRKGPEYKIIFE